MSDVTQSTLTVPLGSDNFEFKIPTLYDEIRIGARMSEIRKNIDPAWDGFTQGLDGNTLYILRAAATFDVLLLRASQQWPFQKTATGPVVDSGKFPENKVNDSLLIYQGFTEALTRFREGRTADEPKPASEAVAGQ